VRQPALVVSAQRDTVVRRAASEPLAEALGDARLLKAGVGHIGMVVGGTAIDAVWEPLADFLLS
jgi:polyhydroxyalkanoate synthase